MRDQLRGVLVGLAVCAVAASAADGGPDLAIVLREDLTQNPALEAEYKACEAENAIRSEENKNHSNDPTWNHRRLRDCPYSRIYLMPSLSSTTIEEAPSEQDKRLQAIITLPLPYDKSAGTFDVPVRRFAPNDSSPGRFKRTYIEVDLSKDIASRLVKYLGDYDTGRRFEPVLEIKNLAIDKEETTLVTTVPVAVTLEFDGPNSALLNGEVIFKAIYLPAELEPIVKEPTSWKAEQGAALSICGVKISYNFTQRLTNQIGFGLLNLSELGEGVLSLSFSEAGVKALENRQRKSGESGVNARQLRTQNAQILRRSFRNPRPLRFRFGSPVVPGDYPLYARFEFTSSANPKGGRDSVAGVDLSLNLDTEGKTEGPLKGYPILGKKNLVFAPALKVKINNIANVDNENSLRWYAPINWNLENRVSCTAPCAAGTGTCCSKPFFRGVTLLAGLNGEHSAFGQNQNIVIPIESVWRFRQINAPVRKDWNVSMDLTAGYQAGRVIDKSTAAFVTVADSTRKIPYQPRLDTAIGRIHLQGKLSVGLGKNRSFNFGWDRWQLLRNEQFLQASEVEGTFTSERPPVLPAGIVWEPIKQKVTFYSPDYRKGFRHYWSGKFVWELTDHVSFDVSYFRGELPPAFQYVDKFTVGIAYQIKP